MQSVSEEGRNNKIIKWIKDREISRKKRIYFGGILILVARKSVYLVLKQVQPSLSAQYISNEELDDV